MTRPPLDPAYLRRLWDFTDPLASAERFRAAAEDEESPPEHRAELLTQYARALGLQDRFADAETVLDGVDATSHVVAARVALERGRCRRSAGDPAAAVPFFRDAVTRARAAGVEHLAVDALHMLALADAGAEERWTRAALDVVGASSDPEVQRWSVALHTNLGWTLHDAGRLTAALDAFTAAHTAALAHGSTDQEQIARWSIARCLRSLGRTEEAAEMQRRLLRERPDDVYVHEELAALGVPAVPDAPT